MLFAEETVTARQMRQRAGVSLAGLTRMIVQLAIVRAGELSGLRRRRLTYFKRGRDLRTRHLFRSLIGSRLRRRLKHKNPATRIAILIGVLRDLDGFARPLAQRMRRRLTRLWPIAARALAAAHCEEPPALPPALADTS